MKLPILLIAASLLPLSASASTFSHSCAAEEMEIQRADYALSRESHSLGSLTKWRDELKELERRRQFPANSFNEKKRQDRAAADLRRRIRQVEERLEAATAAVNRAQDSLNACQSRMFAGSRPRGTTAPEDFPEAPSREEEPNTDSAL